MQVFTRYLIEISFLFSVEHAKRSIGRELDLFYSIIQAEE